MEKIKLAILTPTYNREKFLNRLFESLQNQTNLNFVWYVVDDGSQDNTQKVIEDFKQKSKFKIEYIKKENGGKHTALNVGISKINEELTFIVDSDDMLTKDAVKTIYLDMSKIKDDIFCGVSYLRGIDETKQIGSKFDKDYYVDNFVNARYNKKVKGDKAEVFKTACLKEFPFPVFEGERFISEAVVWAKMSGPYKFLFINKIIYICEYQQGGLSDNSRRLIYSNPKGATLCYNTLSGKGFNLKNKIKHTLLYATSALGAGYKKIIKNSNNSFLCFFLMPFAHILHKKWKKKYEKK